MTSGIGLAARFSRLGEPIVSVQWGAAWMTGRAAGSGVCTGGGGGETGTSCWMFIALPFALLFAAHLDIANENETTDKGHIGNEGEHLVGYTD